MVLLMFQPGEESGAAGTVERPKPCGLTTLEATIRVADNGHLECAPGEPIEVRQDVVKLQPDSGAIVSTIAENKVAKRTPVAAFFVLTDFQLADEESPARQEWADGACSGGSNWFLRPQEAMVPHLLNAQVGAANAIAQEGSPMLDTSLDFALALGDLADNAQHNELRSVIDILDGNKLVDPDSGTDGYDGVQRVNPRGSPNEDGARRPIRSPINGHSIQDLANEPFWATGLRTEQGPLPWYSLVGNHDVKFQGIGPISEDSGDFPPYRAHAVGSLKVMASSEGFRQELCNDPTLLRDRAFWESVNSDPSTTRSVPDDPDRRLLDRGELIDEYSTTTGVPVGHGLRPTDEASATRCVDRQGRPLERGCYAFDHGLLRVIALDTAPGDGFSAGGNVDRAQFKWLERELTAHSMTNVGDDGKRRAAGRKDRLIVVLSHHTLGTMGKRPTPEAPPNQGDFTGNDLKRLLLRFPNVILHLNGHVHRNGIRARRDPVSDGHYWEVTTSSIAAPPHQSRTIEIADNGDGTMSIFTVMVDPAVAPNHRHIDFGRDDDTDEVALSGNEVKQSIAEDWLASAALEVGRYDPGADLTKKGTPADRNVELLMDAPFPLRAREARATEAEASDAPSRSSTWWRWSLLAAVTIGGTGVLGVLLSRRRRTVP